MPPLKEDLKFLLLSINNTIRAPGLTTALKDKKRNADLNFFKI